jgi:hypothetical protein
MILPEIRHIQSAELEPPNLPADPADCEIGFQALIGPKDGEGQEVFRFTVLTAARISSFAEGQWGRGKLILPAFDWTTVVRAVAKLLAESARPTWGEVVAALDKELVWEAGESRTEES